MPQSGIANFARYGPVKAVTWQWNQLLSYRSSNFRLSYGILAWPHGGKLGARAGDPALRHCQVTALPACRRARPGETYSSAPFSLGQNS